MRMNSWLRTGAIAVLGGLSFAAPAAAQDEGTVETLEQECAGGDMGACNTLGGKLFNGDGVETDVTRAAEFFTIGCEGGSWKSCRNLGMMHGTGTGFEQDVVRSAEYYARACDLDDAYSCGRMGEFYFKGEGVAENKPRGLELFDKACSGGSVTACVILGSKYYDGDSVEQDIARAVDYFSLGCDGGDAVSCRNVGVLNAQGSGVEKNIPRAALFYGKACEGGDQQGCDVVQSLESSCLGSYSDFAIEGEFGPDKPKIISFIFEIGGDPKALFGQPLAGVAPSMAEIDQPFDEGEEDRASDRLDPGEAQIVIWADGVSRYIHVTPELTDADAAVDQVQAVCGLMGKGLVLDSANSNIILATYTVPSD